jgi:hypothetical protein
MQFKQHHDSLTNNMLSLQDSAYVLINIIAHAVIK